MNNYILTFVYCGQVIQLYKSHDVRLVQYERMRRKKMAEYQKGKLQIRTEIGLKIKPIL